jgi:hypothetical protein
MTERLSNLKTTLAKLSLQLKNELNEEKQIEIVSDFNIVRKEIYYLENGGK